MEVNPLVSVCMITFNHEKFIREAIEGVLMQEVDFDVEFIIADDASPDFTEGIVQDFIQNHPKGHWIKYFKHAENKGMMENFIWTLYQSRGKYIAFCEGDDIWGDSHKLAKQTRILNSDSTLVISFHQAEFISELGVRSGKNLFSFNQDTVFSSDKIILGQLIPLFSALFVNHKCLKNIPESVFGIITGDILIFTLLGQYGCAHYSCSISPSLYRLHYQSNWSSKSLFFQKNEILKSLIVISSLVKPKYRPLLKKKICDYSYEIGKISKRENMSYLSYFKRSIKIGVEIFYFKIIILSILKIIK